MQKQAIVFNGQEVGIAVPTGDRLRFIAVRFNIIDLDGRIFDSVNDIRTAIVSHLSASSVSSRLLSVESTQTQGH
ncbi:hypothetical protein [Rhizobium sp. Root1220]|uniref:hypothetical protein n=1 Tax=Rhizobium sp. Root1220 TaxID=1736432 RepID=UPI0006F3A75E|nr:hypothetical protein [Rhizobium sp. Root1220]KQV83364.1 hypothetical protein ASC90_20610 [Rhizobium sp. Root1220]